VRRDRDARAVEASTPICIERKQRRYARIARKRAGHLDIAVTKARGALCLAQLHIETSRKVAARSVPWSSLVAPVQRVSVTNSAVATCILELSGDGLDPLRIAVYLCSS
jgi:hypothetical protein